MRIQIELKTKLSYFLARSKNGLCDHYLSRCFFAKTFERNGLGT
jgi:hypothetical protein